MPGPSHYELLPVFVSKESLTFYVDDPSSHKQILTIYNPYGHHVKFKIVYPKNYGVAPSEGVILKLNCQEVIVSHKAVSRSNTGITDEIVVKVFCRETREYGEKIVKVTLEGTNRESAAARVAHQPNVDLIPAPDPRQQPVQPQRKDTTYLVICAGTIFVCLVALFLPSEGQENYNLPSYLCLSHTLKLIAAYVIGLLTAVFLRT